MKEKSALAERVREDGGRLREEIRRRGIGDGAVILFREVVRDFYRDYGRSFPWRRTRDPYRVLVSEFMLQQTQVQRVESKYGEFLGRFPDFPSLAASSLAGVLTLWQGLGYNRRAMALRETARTVVARYGGRLPRDAEALSGLPGVGPATAGAVRAFAFGLPDVFIETNIRRVYLHFFFPRGVGVQDRQILRLVERTLDGADPRRWYWALMDYGAALKGIVANPNRRSGHYRRQSPFEGSDRQIRSAVLRALLLESPMAERRLVAHLGVDPGRARAILETLGAEGFISRVGGRVSIAAPSAPPRGKGSKERKKSLSPG